MGPAGPQRRWQGSPRGEGSGSGRPGRGSGRLRPAGRQPRGRWVPGSRSRQAGPAPTTTRAQLYAPRAPSTATPIPPLPQLLLPAPLGRFRPKPHPRSIRHLRTQTTTLYPQRLGASGVKSTACARGRSAPGAGGGGAAGGTEVGPERTGAGRQAAGPMKGGGGRGRGGLRLRLRLRHVAGRWAVLVRWWGGCAGRVIASAGVSVSSAPLPCGRALRWALSRRERASECWRAVARPGPGGAETWGTPCRRSGGAGSLRGGWGRGAGVGLNRCGRWTGRGWVAAASGRGGGVRWPFP